MIILSAGMLIKRFETKKPLFESTNEYLKVIDFGTSRVFDPARKMNK